MNRMKKFLPVVWALAFFISAGAVEAATTETQFLELCKSGTSQEIEAAIKSGADVNAKDDNGVTALMFAAVNNTNPEVIKVLINAGAEVDHKNKFGHKALYYAEQNGALKGNKEVLRLLSGGAATAKPLDGGGAAPAKPLKGTLWRCVQSIDSNPSIWQFAADGEMNNIHSDNIQVSIGDKWLQEDAKITVEINGGYAVYKGEFRSPSRIEGTAGNIVGENWTFVLTQISNTSEIRRYERIFKSIKETGVYTEVR